MKISKKIKILRVCHKPEMFRNKRFHQKVKPNKKPEEKFEKINYNLDREISENEN